jgi:uncharacterized membrane protein
MSTVMEKSSTGIDANIAAALCYVQPIGIVFLAIEKTSAFVKFHAMQATVFLVAAIAIWVAYVMVASIASIVPILGWIFSFLLWMVLVIGLFVAWLIAVIKAFQGERYKLPFIGNIAEQQASKLSI